jgi:hypothetical protein
MQKDTHQAGIEYQPWQDLYIIYYILGRKVARTFNINIHTLELDDQNVKHSSHLYAHERWLHKIYSFDSLVSLHQVRVGFPFLFEKS